MYIQIPHNKSSLNYLESLQYIFIYYNEDTIVFLHISDFFFFTFIFLVLVDVVRVVVHLVSLYLVIVRCYSFFIIMATAQPFVTSENVVPGPTSIYWSAVLFSDGWSVIYVTSTMISQQPTQVYIMIPIKLMFLLRGV